MTYPTDAVSRLSAWDTQSFDQLPAGAVIQQFDQLARDYSLIVTFTLEEADQVVADAATVAGLKADATEDAADVEAARQAAETSATAAAGSEAEANASAAVAAARAAELTPAMRTFLFGFGGPAWQAL